MKIIRLIQNCKNGMKTREIKCSNIVYEKLIACQRITGKRIYDVDILNEFQGRAKTNWWEIKIFLIEVFSYLPVQHCNHIMNFILSNKK
jgi:hypothetical protein